MLKVNANEVFPYHYDDADSGICFISNNEEKLLDLADFALQERKIKHSRDSRKFNFMFPTPFLFDPIKTLTGNTSCRDD